MKKMAVQPLHTVVPEMWWNLWPSVQTGPRFLMRLVHWGMGSHQNTVVSWCEGVAQKPNTWSVFHCYTIDKTEIFLRMQQTGMTHSVCFKQLANNDSFLQQRFIERWWHHIVVTWFICKSINVNIELWPRLSSPVHQFVLGFDLKKIWSFLIFAVTSDVIKSKQYSACRVQRKRQFVHVSVLFTCWWDHVTDTSQID